MLFLFSSLEGIIVNLTQGKIKFIHKAAAELANVMIITQCMTKKTIEIPKRN